MNGRCRRRPWRGCWTRSTPPPRQRRRRRTAPTGSGSPAGPGAGGYPPLPTPPAVLAHYITEAAAEQTGIGTWRYAPATQTRWVASINQVHTAAGLDAPGRSEVVRRALSGIRRIRATPPNRRAPLLLADIRTLMISIGETAGGWPAGVAARRDMALLLMGFAGAHRRSGRPRRQGDVRRRDRRDDPTPRGRRRVHPRPRSRSWAGIRCAPGSSPRPSDKGRTRIRSCGRPRRRFQRLDLQVGDAGQQAPLPGDARGVRPGTRPAGRERCHPNRPLDRHDHSH